MFVPPLQNEFMKLLKSSRSQEDQEDLTIQDWITQQGFEVGEKNGEGLSLMHLAASEGRVDIMVELKSRGESISAKDNEGSMPIFDAAGSGQIEAMHWLKEQGTDVNAAAEDGTTPVFAAAMSGQIEAMVYPYLTGRKSGGRKSADELRSTTCSLSQSLLLRRSTPLRYRPVSRLERQE
jgi:ankyrin repeat protein